MNTRSLQCDVLIVGGGLVGSALAIALSQAELRTVLVEVRDPRELRQPSFDDRVTALANGSQRILASLGLWEAVRADAEPIRSIHISERGRFGASRIRAEEEGVQALGYTLENRVLGKVMWTALQATAGFTCLAPARLRCLDIFDEAVQGQVEISGEACALTAKLLVAADGARSEVRQALAIDARQDDYAQYAVVLNVQTDSSHRGRAFERFTPSGPLAFLPLSGSRLAVVWTLQAGEVQRVMALDDDAFRCELQSAFGYRLGGLTRVGARRAYPLARVLSAERVRDRAVLIGNAAASLHPVAGQGFNMALRDVAALAEIIADEVRQRGLDADVGAPALLERYDKWRSRDQQGVAAFTHGLVRLFGYRGAAMGVARGLGLLAFDLLPGAKTQLARHTMGLAGRLPRLARGLRLR